MERPKEGFEPGVKTDHVLPTVLRPESYSYANRLRGSLRKTGIMLKWLVIGSVAATAAATFTEYIGFSKEVVFMVGVGAIVLGGIAYARELNKAKRD